MDEETKDAVVGAGSVIAAAVVTNPVIAATVPALVALGLDRISKKSRERARDIVQRMIAVDETPAEFAEFLNARIMDEDEAVIGAMRTLLVASVDALSLAALEPMSLIGRQYLRQRTPAWVARGWLRLLAELSDEELAALRQTVRVGGSAWRRMRDGDIPVRLRAVLGADDSLWIQWADTDNNPAYVAKGQATRLLALLQHFHLGRYVFDQEAGMATRRAFEPNVPKQEFEIYTKAFASIADAMGDIAGPPRTEKAAG